MLAKKVLRNGIGLNSRIKEQIAIYRDWKELSTEFNDEEIQGILTDARADLLESIRMKRNLEEIIMDNNNNADQREILRLRYFYAATWAAIADELNDTVEWVKEQHRKALKKIHVEVTDYCEEYEGYAEEE